MASQGCLLRGRKDKKKRKCYQLADGNSQKALQD